MNDKKFEETLGVTKIDGSVAGTETQKTLPFSQALHILLETDEGIVLEKERSEKKISAKEFEARLMELSEKYRHLILI